MLPTTKQTVKDALENFEECVRTLSRLYSENEELNDIQPDGKEEYESDIHGHTMLSDAADIYPFSLDEWTDQIQVFVEQFGINLDKHDKECPFSSKILMEQLGSKVGEYPVEKDRMSGSVGIYVGERIIYATPDWDESWDHNELIIQVTEPDGDMEYGETYVFDYSAPLIDMVNMWKEIVLKEAEKVKKLDVVVTK